MIGRVLTGGSAVAAALFCGAAICFARRVVTPSASRTEAVVIHGMAGPDVLLGASSDTETPGIFSLYFSNKTGHARIGKIIGTDPESGTVSREVEETYYGDLTGASRGYWSGYAYATPAHAGLAGQNVQIKTHLGPAPAWLIPAADDSTWAIHIHGMGGKRATGLRTAGFFHRSGITSLLVSYRGDGEAPPSPDGRHHLGQSEAADVEAALNYATACGAKRIILIGWSLGSTIALALAAGSPHRHLIAGLILTPPVLNWEATLLAHGRRAGIPSPVGRLGLRLLCMAPLNRLAGLDAPLDFRAMNWIRRASEIDVPVLALHSLTDTDSSYALSAELGSLRPDMVTVVPFVRARHTHEWNTDPDRWEEAVERWLDQCFTGRPASSPPPRTRG